MVVLIGKAGRARSVHSIFSPHFRKLKSGYAAVSVNSPHCYQITMGRKRRGQRRGQLGGLSQNGSMPPALPTTLFKSHEDPSQPTYSHVR